MEGGQSEALPSCHSPVVVEGEVTGFPDPLDCQPTARGLLGSAPATRKKVRKERARLLAIHWGFIGPCYAGGAWLDMYTLSLLGDREAGGALGNSR
jgi:hypothetical protein